MNRRLTVVFSPALVLAMLMAVLPPGGSYVDDDGNVHEGGIEAIAAEGITQGCDPPANDRYCPDRTVTRAQMAVFLARALHLPDTANDYFGDDEGHVLEGGINRLRAAGITQGCDGNRFCPDREMSRGEMAAMLARAFNYPPSNQDRFIDDDGHIFEGAIQRIAVAGITVGCNPPANNRFCPDQKIRRDQMATFLTRALDLTPDKPPARCPTLPADDIWNTPIDDLPVHSRSGQYVSSIGGSAHLHPDFGSGVWPPGSNSPIGIPFVEVPEGTPAVTITYTAYGNESDPGPFPIPGNAPIEGGPDATGDRHVIVVDRFRCELFELFNAHPGPGTSWRAASGALPARLLRAQTGRLDVGRRGRVAHLPRAGPLRPGGIRSHRPCHPVHRTPDPVGSCLAGAA